MPYLIKVNLVHGSPQIYIITILIDRDIRNSSAHQLSKR